MLGPSTKYKVYQMLSAIGENEEIVEEQRQQLARQHGFEPWAAFKRLDRAGWGKVSANDILTFLNENMVDYLTECQCYHMFSFFDKDEDGLLDYQDFLQLVLPTTDVQLRASVAQRANYECLPNQRLQSNVEFELSRLFEKEIHYHVKVEQEKLELEQCDDFCSVAVFSVLDPLSKGYLDADAIKQFCLKQQNKHAGPALANVTKSHLNAMMRRITDQPDGRVTFREFCLAITPEVAGLPIEALERTEFNTDLKDDLHKQNVESPQKSQKSVRGPFRSIHKQPLDSPTKQEFKHLNLKQPDDPDTRYVLDMVKMGSPSKDKDNLMQSRKILNSVERNAVVHNFVEGTDRKYDKIWDETLHGPVLNPVEKQFTMLHKKNDNAFRQTVDSMGSAFPKSQSRIFSQNQSYGSGQDEPEIGGFSNVQFATQGGYPQTFKTKVNNTQQSRPNSSGRLGSQERKFRNTGMSQGDSADYSREPNSTLIRTTVSPAFPLNEGAQELLSRIARHEVSLELLRQKLVRECPDFNTVDAFRLIDVHAQCQVNSDDLWHHLSSEPLFMRPEKETVDLLVNDEGVVKYSDYCDWFVPKSQKVLAELQSKTPKNVDGRLTFSQCFCPQTKELYIQAWQHILNAVQLENEIKINLMRDASFDITAAFKQMSRGKDTIMRDDLAMALTQLDQPHIDILYARLCQRQASKDVTYASFIENLTPKGALY